MRAINSTGSANPLLKEEIDWLGYVLSQFDRKGDPENGVPLKIRFAPATERAIKEALSGMTVDELAALVKSE